MTKAASLLLAVVVLTGCGDGLQGDDKTAAENIATGIADSGTPLSEKEATCYSERLVDSLGLDKLQEYGVIDEDLEYADQIGTIAMSESDATKAADAFVDCVDLETKLAELSVEQGEQLDCITGGLDDAAYRALMKATYMLDEDAIDRAMAPVQECLLVGLPTDLPTPTPTESTS